VTSPEEQNVSEENIEAVEELVAADAVEVVEEVAAATLAPIVLDRPVQTVGRRKEAVVRVRMTPGTGQAS
jgi:small subunit ribosomal protein S9